MEIKSDNLCLSGEEIYKKDPLITIYLAIFKGSRFLEKQLNSIAAQQQNIKIVASLDAEDPESIEILNHFMKTSRIPVIIQQGPKKGFASNFLSMVCNDKNSSNYYAYCDQDDIWYSDKLKKAILWLDSQDQKTPLLWCSTMMLIDTQDDLIGPAEVFNKEPGFKNALVQCIGAGCSMIFNQKTKELLQQGGMVDVAFHDWWTYLLVTGCEGICHYEQHPTVYYRQHANVLGSNKFFRAKLRRIQMLREGEFSKWNRKNINALNKMSNFLSKENLTAVKEFEKLSEYNIIQRLIAFKKLGIYRQTLLGNIAILIACVFKKL